MSECSKYQLLLQTDYVRLREKLYHLYFYLHILSYSALRESSQQFFETKDYCPVECSDGCCKTIAACETVVDRNTMGSTVKCENSCPIKCSDDCCNTIGACETVVGRNSTGSLLSMCNEMKR
jgi:hypothetical protein